MISNESGINRTIGSLIASFLIDAISEERKSILNLLMSYIQSKVDDGLEIRLNFICTHNSRRSHLSQVWAQTLAYYFDIKGVSCYSGGTEPTALFPMVVETLQKSGFEINKLSQDNNPVYSIKYSKDRHPVIGFSKKYDDDFNPSTKYAAILTCDSADEACPMVIGAEVRIPITFDDPKVYDYTEKQAEMYEKRSRQIATELFYVFSQIKLK